MRTLLIHSVSVLSVGIFLSAFSAPLSAQSAHRRLHHAPEVLSYDWEADEFEYAKSVLSPGHPARPGGPLAYYGNRLTQFIFVGPPEMAGIYGAMQDYKRATRRDPAKHQYRWMGYSK